MSFPTLLFTLLIRPIGLLLEVLFYYAGKVFRHPDLSILALSLAVNFLSLPLYLRAEALQDKERSVKEKMASAEAHIRKTFQGNERYFMLRTFYRQNDYHPVYALRGSLTLLLEIPFFIAAYHFLSNLGALGGASLGRISDLGRPDALIRSGSISINLLPILMLVFNAASAMLYTDKLPDKNTTAFTHRPLLPSQFQIDISVTPVTRLRNAKTSYYFMKK